MLNNQQKQLFNEVHRKLLDYKEIRPLSIVEIKKVLIAESQAFVPVIFPSAWINGLGILRGLGRNGFQSVVMDPQENALCFYSKFAIPYQCNSIVDLDDDKESQLFSDLYQISQAIKSSGKEPVLFITASEKLLAFINKYLEQLSNLFIFTADFKNQLYLEDKKVQLEFAVKAGIEIPKTTYISNRGEFDRFSGKLDFPLIIKPRSGKMFYKEFGVQAFKVNTETEFLNTYNKVEKYQLIVQEEVQGPDQNLYTLGSYFGKQREPLALFTGKKLKSNRDFGTCSIGKSVEAPEIIEMGCNLLYEMHYHGASQIEFKLDDRDQKFKFIEINNRFWKWHSLAIESNVNIPYIQLLDSIDQIANHNVPDQYFGKIWWMMLSDLYSTKTETPAEDIIDKIITIGEDFVDGVGSWDDPLPALINFLQFNWL